MAIAIETKYVGATNSNSSRIAAKTFSMSRPVYVNYDHSLSTLDNHKNAAKKLLDKMNYSNGEFVYAMSPRHATGYVFIRQSDDTVTI